MTPDQMIYGQWYRVVTSKSANWLIRFREITERNIGATHTIDTDSRRVYSGQFLCDIKSVDSVEHATQSDVENYFPNFKWEPQYEIF